MAISQIGSASLASPIGTINGTNLTLANDASISGLTVGYQAGYATTGTDNTAIGDRALIANTTATNNTAVGSRSAYTNTTGSNNVAVGSTALFSNTTATNNTAVGYQAGYASAEIWNEYYTKLYSDSYLYVEIDLSMRGNYSDHLTWEMNYAGGTYYQGTMPYDSGFGANARPFYSTFWLDAIPAGTLGTRPMVLDYWAGNGSGGEKPSGNINPHRRNDERLDQEYSSCTVYELAR